MMMLQTDAGEEGDIEVAEHETNGRYIRIHNKGDEEVSIGGWQLKSAAPGREVSYKFHSRQALKPGKTITVSRRFYN
jgi:lamin B